MKKLIFLVILICYGSEINSQSFNRAYHSKNEISNRLLVHINGSTYFTTNTIEAGNNGSCYIYKHNQSGTLKFRSGALIYYFPTSAYKTMDNKLLITGREPFCDVIPQSQKNYISKVDTMGILVFQTTNTVTSGDSYKASIQLSDSSYCSFTDSLLFTHSKTGQFISKKNLGLKSISSALLLTNNTILLSAKQGTINSLIQISPTGSVITAKPFTTLLTKMAFYSTQNIIGLSMNSLLYKISPTFNLITSSSSLFATDFVCNKDTIYTVGSTTYGVCDTMFNSIISFSTAPALSHTALCLIPASNGAAILSQAQANNSFGGWGNHFFVSVNAFNKFAGYSILQDVAILSVQKDSSYILNNYSYLRAKVVVKNKSLSVLNSFKLNCFIRPAVDCGNFYYQQQFANLSVQPGDSVSVITNSFIEHYIPFSGYGTYCFYTSLPNGEADKVFADNDKCGTFNFTAGINRNDGNEMSLNVMPNPFINNVTISADVNLHRIEIFDIIGKLLHTYQLNDSTVTLNTSELSNGIYFLKIETDKGVVVKKILK